jgi:LacI family transcriptional regulator
MTIRELARLTGTSHMTVSRALNNHPLVAPETRRRILDAASRYGYWIDEGARGLATGVRSTVGVLYPEGTIRPYESWYTAELMDAIRMSLRREGIDTMIAGYDGVDGHEVTRLVARKKVDGVVVIGNELAQEHALALAGINAAYVWVNPPEEEWTRAHPCVRIDQAEGGSLAAGALRASGRRRLVTVSDASIQDRSRVDGFRRAVGPDLGVESISVPESTYEAGYNAVTSMAEPDKYDGYFACSDACALGVINALLDRGVQVPDDVSVVGFDDIEWARYSRPALTTIHQPTQEVAEAAVSVVLGAVRDEIWNTAGGSGPNARERDDAGISDDGPAQALFEPYLVKRDSC